VHGDTSSDDFVEIAIELGLRGSAIFLVERTVVVQFRKEGVLSRGKRLKLLAQGGV